MTWLFGVETNITPLFTIGADWCARTSPVRTVHMSCNRATFSVLICVSGL